MMMLPLVFTFFLARFPAGLVIYWTANNPALDPAAVCDQAADGEPKNQPAKST